MLSFPKLFNFCSDYAEYNPTIPKTLPVPLTFGSSQELLIDGFLPEKEDLIDFPTVVFTDKNDTK